MKLAVVSYIYPDTVLWARIIAARPSIVILNPDSGPGASRDPNYAILHGRLIAARIPTLCYVRTDYGNVPYWQAYNDRKKYRDLYGPMSGTFWDEQHDGTIRLSYYESLCRDGDLNVLNPGSFCDEAYTQTGAILMVYETDYADYLPRQPLDWMRRYPTWHCVHSVPNAAVMRNVVATAKERKAAYLSINSDPADYDTLPPWFEEMAALVKTV